MHNRIVNKTRYDDLEKLMKQTSFIVKKLGGNLPEKQSTIIKRSFRSSTKPLSLDSTILIDELIAETFYRFKTSELFNIWKRSLRSSTKLLSLDSTIPVDELTVETFYYFRTSKLFNIWMLPFLFGFQYVTKQWCIALSMWLTHQLEEDVGCKVLHFINNEDQEALGYQTLRRKRRSNFFQRE